MKKKILAILLVLGMLLTMTPMVFAEPEEEKSITLSINGGEEENYNSWQEVHQEIKKDKTKKYTVKLYKDQITSYNPWIYEDITIDLNGHTFESTTPENAGAFKIIDGGKLKITGTGTIKHPTKGVAVYGNYFDNGTITSLDVGSDVTIEVGEVGIHINQRSKDRCYGAVVNFDGQIKSDTYGIFVIGNIKQTSGNVPKITIGENAVIEAMRGVNIHGYAEAIVNEGAKITGEVTGIEIRAGKLTVNGGTIIGNGTETTVNPNSNGTSTNGAGIGIAQHTTKLPIEVVINGGTIKGHTAINEKNPETGAQTDKVKFEINGGTFEGTGEGGKAVNTEEDRTGFITGGRFIPEQPEDKYVAEGIEFKEDPAKPGEYIVDDGSEEEPGGDEKPDDEKPDDDDEKPDDEKPDDKKPSKDKDHSSGSSSSRKTTKKQEPVASDASIQSTVNGKVSLDPKAPKAGDEVTLTVTPDKGYEIDTVQVTDKNGDEVKLTDKGNGKYSFTMPDSKINVLATFKAVEEVKAATTTAFTDVPADAYFADAVKWAVAKGITTGTTEITFSPNASCTRAQMVTFLWRAAGSPEPADPDNPFEDIAEDAYYYKAVLWAVEQGITKGVSDTEFAPEDTVTRGQTATFLYRYADAPAVEGENEFTDVPADEYYADAVQWAVDKDVTKGTSETTFSPADDCTRGQIVTFLYRYMAD